MIKIYRILLFIGISFINQISLAQVPSNSSVEGLKNVDVLKNLKKVEPGDFDERQPLMLNPMEMPMYTEELTLINPNDFFSIISSGNYVPEPYLDSNKVIKLVVFRKATEVEKKQMQLFENDLNTGNQLIGTQAYNFSVKDIKGNTFSLSDLKDKVVVLNFWFLACKPCVMEIPALNELVEKFKNKHVVFIGFALNERKEIKEFLKNQEFEYNLVASSQKIADKFNVQSYPTHLIIDKNSIIAYDVSGLTPSTVEELSNMIEQLLTE